MRIVNRDSFLAMPIGTLFSKYQPCIFEPPCIKRESIENDFFYTEIIADVKANSSDEQMKILLAAEETGNSFDLEFDSSGRDGCFNNDQLFVIWEPKDIEGLIGALQTTLPEFELATPS